MGEEQVDDYNAHLVGDFEWSILGMGAGAFFAICCGSICAACCCCKCCESTRAKIRAMDPRNHIRNMAPETQMAALGAVAANEDMDNQAIPCLRAMYLEGTPRSLLATVLLSKDLVNSLSTHKLDNQDTSHLRTQGFSATP